MDLNPLKINKTAPLTVEVGLASHLPIVVISSVAILINLICDILTGVDSCGCVPAWNFASDQAPRLIARSKIDVGRTLEPAYSNIDALRDDPSSN